MDGVETRLTSQRRVRRSRKLGQKDARGWQMASLAGCRRIDELDRSQVKFGSVGSSSATSLPARVLRAPCHLHALSGRRAISSWPFVTESPACTPRRTRRARALRLSRHPCAHELPPRARSSQRARDLPPRARSSAASAIFTACTRPSGATLPATCPVFPPAACAGKPQLSPRLGPIFFTPRGVRQETATSPATWPNIPPPPPRGVCRGTPTFPTT